MKRIKKLLSYAILLGGIALLPACGGGDYGEAAADDSSNQTFVEPVKSGVLLSSGLNGRAVVGETYEGKLYVTPIDKRNQIASYTVSNPTTGGAVPTVSAGGTVTWMPNAIDINTPALNVVVTLAQGETPTSALTVPVSVYAKTLEMTADIVPDQAFYSDPEGVYVVQIGVKPGVTPSGKIEVYSYKSANGKSSYSVESTDPNIFGILREYPRSDAAVASLTTQANYGKKAANAGLFTRNEWEEFNVEALGSLMESEKNIYSLRKAPLFNQTVIQDANGAYRVVKTNTAIQGQQILQIDSSCSLSSNGCIGEKAPVILIHGFTPERVGGLGLIDFLVDGGIGGGEGTWGSFPTHLRKDNGHDVFEFRWLTQIRFEEAAGQLTKLINKIALKTGKKPIIVAHSFGGIVSHLALSGQGIEWKNEQWENVRLGNGIIQTPSDVVDKLITLGSPIGGIYDGSGVTLPGMEWGRQHAEVTINTCLSITCVQAGASDVGIASFREAMTAIKYPMPTSEANGYLPWSYVTDTIARRVSPDLLNYAESIARIGKITTGNTAVDSISPVLHGVKTIALVGVGTSELDPVTDDVGKLGDGLISLKGQIHPNDVSVLNTFFTQSNLVKSEINLSKELIKTVDSKNVPNMKYIFVGNMGHTAIGLHSDSRLHEIPEPYVTPRNEEGKYSYCVGLKHTRKQSYFPVEGIYSCVGSVVRVVHPLVTMIDDSNFFDSSINYTNTNMVARAWDAFGTVKTSAILVAAAEAIPFSIEIRDRSTGDRVMRTFAYATNIDGNFQIDLNSLIDVSIAGFNRANLYANLYLGDGLTYEAQRVSIQNLNLDRIDIPEITLERIANRPGMINVSGRVIDGQTAGLGIDQAVIRIAKGIGLSATDLQYVSTSNTSRVVRTDASGNFFINQLRPGIYSAFVQKAGYVDEIQGRLTVSANGSLTLSLLKILAPGEASVTLRWDTAAGGPTVVSDLDSHMLRFNAAGVLDYHIFYSARLGLDGDSLDRDDTNYEGPETVTFNPKSAKNYVYYVHQFSSAGTIPGSKPLVTVRLGSQAYRFDLPVSASTTGRYWRVFDMVNGQVRPCTANCLQTAAPNTITTQSGAAAQLSADVRPYMSSMPAKQ